MSPLRRIRGFIFLALANLLASVSCQQICGEDGNYTTNSTYHANLNTLLSILPANIDENGFYNASVGQNTDMVNAYVLCRGDLQLHECRSCIQGAAVAVVELCPNQRQATFLNGSCTVRYSDHSVFRTVAVSPWLGFMNIINATSPDEFNTDQRILLENLRKVAAGNTRTTNSQTIYALVQCTPYLNADDCTTCLISGAQKLSRCCDSKIGAGVQCPSCSLRYETYSFYNESRLIELEPMPIVPTDSLTPVAPTPSSIPVPPRSPGPGNVEKTGRSQIIVITVVSVSAGLILFIIAGFLLRKKMELKSKEKLSTANEISVVESLHYEFDEVKAATNDFSEANKLGQGGFGAVYRGKLPNGQQIAVKRLSTDSSQGDSEFKNEAMVLAKLQHRNLIRLLGFSLEGTEKLLVYEVLQNTSLDRFIFDPERCSNLDWDKRYKIVRGIARGLLYLHEDSQLRIIHRVLKAGNILLDEDMNPKIADFGSARLFVPDETHANTFRIVGTYGYMAPEYVMHGQFSVKSDVFSFGVLVLEIVSGQKNNRFQNEENREDFLTRAAWRSWQQGNVSNLVDPSLRGSSGIPGDILRCIHISLLCVQKRAADRPTMGSVVLMLNSFSSSLQVPSEPAFYVANDYYLEAPLTDESSSKENNRRAITGCSSENGVSLTEFYPR